MTTLTDRERQVLDGMSRGRENRQIAEALFVSEETVKSHGRSLFAKLGAHNRAHAVRIAFERGLLARPVDPPATTLDDAELAILGHLANGRSIDEACHLIGITRADAVEALHRARTALGAKTVIHAVVDVIRRGLVNLYP